MNSIHNTNKRARDLEHIAELLRRTFPWTATPQGFAYWAEVESNLRILSEKQG
jgi:hypothetical protein